jgi:hypothetical protein
MNALAETNEPGCPFAAVCPNASPACGKVGLGCWDASHLYPRRRGEPGAAVRSRGDAGTSRRRIAKDVSGSSR